MIPVHRATAPAPWRDAAVQALLLLPALLASLWMGWQIQQRMTWLQQALPLQAQVVELRRTTQPGATGTSRSAVRLELVVEVPDPRHAGAVDRIRFLAPLLYALLEEGNTLTVLHDPLTLPEHEPFVLAHPLQLWQAPAFGLLLVAVFWAFPYAALHKRYPEAESRRAAARRRQMLLGLALLLPIAAGQATALRDRAAAVEDLEIESRWPSWPELDAAVPKPWWWARLPWRGLDPVTDAGSEGNDWRFQQPLLWRSDSEASERSFKYARARMLALREQPAALASLLSRGHDANFIPLYRFYLDHYLDAEWLEPGCSRCNDRSLITEMAGDLMLMLIQEGRVAEAGTWAPAIIARKLPEADARARLSFLTAYRGLLEAELGADAARSRLQPLVDEAIVAARQEGAGWALDRWEGFWRGYVPRPRLHPAATRGRAPA